MNFLPCRLDGERRADRGHRCRAGCATGPRLRARLPNATLELGIRPEFVAVTARADETTLPAKVERVEDLGNYKLVTARLGPALLKAKLDEDAQVPGETAHLTFAPARTLLYADGRLIG